MKADGPPANRPCWGTVVQRCGSHPKEYSTMHQPYCISVTGRVTNPRHQALHVGIENQHRLHGCEVFLQPHLHADNELPLISGRAYSIHR